MKETKVNFLYLASQSIWCVNLCRATMQTRPLVSVVNTSRPRQNGRHFPDDNLKRIFLNENVWISIKISLKIVPRGPINNIPELVQIMAWRRPGDKPLSEPMMVSLLSHTCVTRLQWFNHGLQTHAIEALRIDDWETCGTFVPLVANSEWLAVVTYYYWLAMYWHRHIETLSA